MIDSTTREKLRAVFLATLMVASVFGGAVAFSGSAAAASGNGTVENVDTGETFDTIQAAIDAKNTSDGDTLVLSGEFKRENGDGAIAVDKAVTIKANSSTGAVINNTGQTANNGPAGVIEIKTSGVTISGVTFQTDASELGGTPPVEMAIQANDTVIKGVTINREDQHAAPGIGTPGTSSTVVNVTVTNNDFNGAAIGFSSPGNGTIEITDNEVNQTKAEGIFLFSGDLANTSLIVNGNTITNYDLGNQDKKAIKVTEVPASINGQATLAGQWGALFDNNNIDSAEIGAQTRTDEPGAPEVTDVTLDDRDGDGNIDAATVTVDENVSDGTLAGGDFTIGGQQVDSVDTLSGTYDETFQLLLNDGNEVEGTGGNLSDYEVVNIGSVTDLAGNDLKTVDQENVTYVDAAEPVLLSAEAEVDSSDVTVTFSEPVYSGTDSSGSLSTADFAYTDGSSDGASGISSVSHSAGSATTTVTLDTSVTSSDLGSDTIEPASADTIYDAYDNPAPAVVATLRDTIAPADPSSTSTTVVNISNVGSKSVDVTIVDDHEQGTVTVRFTDKNDDTVTKDVQVDSESDSDSDPHTVTISGINVSALADGDVTVEAKMADEGNNENSAGFTAATTVEKDTVAPTVTTTFGDGVIGGSSVDVTSLFGVTEDDGGAITYEYSTDSGDTWTAITNTGSWNTTKLADGDILLRATDTDNVGNSDTAQGSVTIDNTDPSVNEGPSATDSTDSDGTADDGVLNKGDTVTVTLNATDTNLDVGGDASVTANASHFGGPNSLVLNDAGTGADDTADDDVFTASFVAGDTSNMSADGDYTIPVTVTDQAGNAITQDTNTLTIDNTAAVGNITSPDSATYKESGDTLQVAYEYTDDFPDVATIKLVASDGTVYTYDITDSQYVDDGTTKTVTLDLDNFDSSTKGGSDSGLDDGDYKVKLVVTDQTGNTETISTSSQFVTVDEDNPSVAVKSVSSTDLAPGDSVTVSVDYDDITAGTVDFTLVNQDTGEEYDLKQGVSVAANTAAAKDVDVTIPSDIEGDNFVIEATASDTLGHQNSDTSSTLNINAGPPSIESVEVAAGHNTATITFSEPVTGSGANGNVTAVDLAYEDVSADGASAVDAILEGNASDRQITVRLNSDVSVNDVGADLISARDGQISDVAGATAGTQGVVVDDTAAPAAPGVSAGPINASNQGAYSVDVSGLHAAATVNVTLTGPDGATASEEVDVAHGAGNITVSSIDASALAEGDVTVSVTLTDAGGNSANSETTTTKDVTAPQINGVHADASTNWVYVNVSEQLDEPTADDFSVSSDVHTVESVDQYSYEGDYWVALELNASVPPAAINNSDVVVSSTAADLAGNEIQNTGKLMDEFGPYITGADAERGSANITVTVDEDAVSADGEFGADDFVYNNSNGEGAGNVTAVEQIDDRTFRVQVDAALSPSDIENDALALNNSVEDLVGNPAFTGDMPLDQNQFPRVSASADGSTVTVTVETPKNISEVGLSLSVDQAHQTINAADNSWSDTSVVDLSAADFEEVEDGVYQATFDAPRDGTYVVSGMLGDTEVGTQVDVDTEKPEVVDSEILDYNGSATLITLQFNEPVEFTDGIIGGMNIEGVDEDRIVRSGQYASNAVYVIVEGEVQTGDSPKIGFVADSYMEASADETAGTDTATTVNTLELSLSEGANFMSVPAASGDLAVSEVVSQLGADNVESIMTYDNGEWQTYNPDKPASENDFDTIEGGQGYIVTLSNGAELEVNVNNVVGGGSASDATPQATELEEGWNLVGQWQEGGQRKENALASISDSTSNSMAVYGQANAGSYTYTEVQSFEPGEAYWVFVTEDTVYTESQDYLEP